MTRQSPPSDSARLSKTNSDYERGRQMVRDAMDAVLGKRNKLVDGGAPDA